ncbi:MAG: hypothetical protein ABWK05_01565 [Pyrobaculum sp.]
MQFKEFINTVNEPLRYYIYYSVKKLGKTLDEVREEELMQVLTNALGGHVAEVLYAMYLEKRVKKTVLVSA